MTVSSTTSTSGADKTASTASTKKDPYANLGMKDFLKLLTTQLKQQDPTQPQDNTQMVAQMAQFSSLSGIGELNTTLSGIATKVDQVIAAQKAAADAATAQAAAQAAAQNTANA